MMFVENCSTVITADNVTETNAGRNFSVAPVKKSFCELGMETLFLFGESLSTIPDSKASTAPFSETNPNTNQVSFSDKLTPLLISHGLVKGTIPMWMRDASGQTILDAVLKKPDGFDAEPQKAGC